MGISEDKMQCPACEARALEFQAYMGAPGIGTVYQCSWCGKEWIKLGGQLLDPEQDWDGDPPWVMDPEDVI